MNNQTIDLNEKSSPVLDPAALKDLGSAVGEDYVPILLQAFIEDLARLREKASIASADGNIISFGQVMHSLNGACSYCGAARLARFSSDPKNSSFMTAADLRAAWAVLAPVLDATTTALSTFRFGAAL